MCTRDYTPVVCLRPRLSSGEVYIASLPTYMSISILNHATLPVKRRKKKRSRRTNSIYSSQSGLFSTILTTR